MDNLSLAINVIFVGVTVVFLSLIFLTLIISMSTRILDAVRGSSGGKKKQTDDASALEIDEVEASDSSASTDELIAVITAAIMSSINASPDYNIRIKFFRRIPQSAPVWNVAGRNEYIAGKL